jgi:hypothetical protein
MNTSISSFENVNSITDNSFATKTAAENHAAEKTQVSEKRRESFFSALMRVLSSVSF